MKAESKAAHGAGHKAANHTPGPFIWLQESESRGRADCGCEVVTDGDPGVAFYQCATHAAAPRMRHEIDPAKFDELADSLLRAVENGDYATVQRWAEWAADKAMAHRAILRDVNGGQP